MILLVIKKWTPAIKVAAPVFGCLAALQPVMAISLESGQGVAVACTAENHAEGQRRISEARDSGETANLQEALHRSLDMCKRFDWLMEAGAIALGQQQWLLAAQAYSDAAQLELHGATGESTQRYLLALSYESLAWLKSGSLDFAQAAATEANDGYTDLAIARPDFLSAVVQEVDTELAKASAGTLVSALNQQLTRGLSRGISVKPKVSLQVLFEFDSDRLTDEGHKMTQKMAEAVDLIINSRALTTTRAESTRTLRIMLIGHTDTQGEEDYNLVLSEKRAAAVAEQVMARVGDRLPEDTLVVVGRGEQEPRYFENTESDNQRNRRVELVVVQ